MNTGNANPDSVCDGQHRFFICDVVAVETEGKVFVLLACTSCGEVKSEEVTVASKGTAIRLLREEKTTKGK